MLPALSDLPSHHHRRRRRRPSSSASVAAAAAPPKKTEEEEEEEGQGGGRTATTHPWWASLVPAPQRGGGSKLGEWAAAPRANVSRASRISRRRSFGSPRLTRARPVAPRSACSLGDCSRPSRATGGRGPTAALKVRLEREKKMFGGMFERAQGDGMTTVGSIDERSRRTRASARQRRTASGGSAKPLTDMWAEHLAGWSRSSFRVWWRRIRLASQMPDTAWQKHIANMTPEALQTARDAIKLHGAQRFQKEGVDVPLQRALSTRRAQ